MRDPPGHYWADEKIELDLRFRPAAHLSGTIVDDRGKPLSGVRLEIRGCTSLIEVDNVRPGWTLDALNQSDTVPPAIKVRTTDANGKFFFTGLPPDCRFDIDVRAKGFPDRWLFAATTDEPQPDHDGYRCLRERHEIDARDGLRRPDQAHPRRIPASPPSRHSSRRAENGSVTRRRPTRRAGSR